MNVPERWSKLNLRHLRGTVLVVGATDVGKTTLAQYLCQRLGETGQTVAYIDGDPGQSTLGPPTTITMALGSPGESSFPLTHYFIGDISPRGHMLPLVVGAKRLVDAAYHRGAQVIIYDTCGLISRSEGGHALKLALVDLLEPTTILALQRHHELESLLLPLRLSHRTRVIDLEASPYVVPRDPEVRRANRSRRFSEYFADARPLEITWTRLAVFPQPQFTLNRLVAMKDTGGFTAALGIVLAGDPDSRNVTLLTPLKSLSQIDALHLGDLALDPQTYESRPWREG